MVLRGVEGPPGGDISSMVTHHGPYRPGYEYIRPSEGLRGAPGRARARTKKLAPLGVASNRSPAILCQNRSRQSYPLDCWLEEWQTEAFSYRKIDITGSIFENFRAWGARSGFRSKYYWINETELTQFLIRKLVSAPLFSKIFAPAAPI